MIEYGAKYGSAAETYAKQAMPKWRNGTTKMSGLVAKRLFDLLPPRMPTKKKYELAENIWKHFGPSSTHNYRIGPNAKVSDIVSIVSNKLDEVANSYNIPENVQNRFSWLADGDVKVKEELLNHFRLVEKELAAKKVKAELPVLLEQVREHGEKTGLAKSVITIHKHEISLWVDDALDDLIQEGRPKTKNSVGDGGFSWVWFPVIAFILYLIFSR